MRVEKFTFGPFSENTYVLVDDESNECIVVDPGMYDTAERKLFSEFMSSNGLTPSLLLNTHCHIDHIMGNAFIYDTYKLVPQIHEKAVQMLDRGELAASMYGINYDPSPAGETSLISGESIVFGNHSLRILFTPGHAPGHVIFHNEKDNYMIGGDVIMKGSVGRVDLPGSNPPDLVKSIQQVVYKLPETTVVYSGHGPETTVGVEKKTNPFIRENESYFS